MAQIVRATTVTTCASAALSYIHSSVHVTDARDQIGPRTIPLVVLPQLLELMSIISWSEYAAKCTKIMPPSSWVSDVVENLLRLTLTLS